MQTVDEPLSELVRACKASTARLARAVLERLPHDSAEAVVLATQRGARIAIETSMDRSAQWHTALVLIEPEGARHVIAEIASGTGAIAQTH